MSRAIDVEGTLTSITYPGAGNSPVVRASLETDDAAYTLAFMGRTQIRCLAIGQRVRVKGTPTTVEGRATIFNPSYEIQHVDS